MFWHCGRCRAFLERETGLVTRWNHDALWNLLFDGCVVFGLDKTQWINTSRWHGAPNYNRLLKLHPELQTSWIFVPNSRNLSFNCHEKCTFYLKRESWTTEVQFIFSLVNATWRSPFSTHFILWHKPESTPWEALQNSWINLLDNLLTATVSPHVALSGNFPLIHSKI